MDELKESKYILNSVDSALSVLNCFFDSEELSAVDIAKLKGMNRSTVYRLLVTLESQGYLTKTENSKYRLGVKIFSLGQLAYRRMELVSLVRPYLIQLSARTNETSHLVVMNDATHVIFADKAVGNAMLTMDTALGLRTPAHLTGSGKAILAFQPEHILTQYLHSAKFESKTPHSLRNGAELLSRIEEIRAQGYAVDAEESELGLTCIALPLIDASGFALAAISISGPTTRINAHRDTIIGALRDANEAITQFLR